MTKPTDGGPVFPTDEIEEMGVIVQYRSTGMSLRDWFAGQALASTATHWSDVETATKRAYRIADAMLLARTGEAK